MEALPVYRPAEDPRAYQVERIPEGWRVSGKAIERAAKMTFWEQEGSLRRFQRLMEKLGVGNQAELIHYALKHRLSDDPNAPA